MSFITGTSAELLYASTGTGTAKNTFTTEANLNDTAGMGERPRLPADFFAAPYGIGKSLLVRAVGIVSSTATPTYTWTLRIGSNGNITTACIALGSAALTTASGISNIYWEFEGLITVRAIGDSGANSTLQGVGRLLCSGISTNTGVNPLYGGAASPGTVATLDTSIVNFFNLNIACSASSASNTITCHALQVFGLN